MLKVNYVVKVNIALNVVLQIQIVAFNVLHPTSLKMMDQVLSCLVCLLQAVLLECMPIQHH